MVGDVNADTTLADRLAIQGVAMRTGGKLGRTLYLETGAGPDQDLCVGIVDTELLAWCIAELWNTHVTGKGGVPPRSAM
jgi:hypothetical protein